MLRFIMVRREKRYSGAEIERHYTIDANVPDVEMALTAGGSSESEYEIHSLIGVSVLPDKE